MDTKSAENYFQAFYIRRALRIFPVFYLVLTALTLVHFSPIRWLVAPVFPLDKQLPFYFVYLNNLLPLDRSEPNILGHFWSLAVEEQFYLIWPLSVWLLPRRNILPVAAGGCLIGLCLRLGLVLDYKFLLHRPPPDFLNTLPFRGLDTLMAGAAVAALVRNPRMLFRFRKSIYVAGAVSGIVVFAMLFQNGPGQVLTRSGQVFNVFGYTLFGLSFGALILSIFETANRPSMFQLILRSAPLTSLGKYSYGLYIYHVPVLVIGLVLLSDKFPIRTSAATSLWFMLSVVSISYCIAVLSYNLFESRILSLKSQFVARHKKLKASAAAI